MWVRRLFILAPWHEKEPYLILFEITMERGVTVWETYSGSFLVWNSSSFIRVVIGLCSGGISCLGFDRDVGRTGAKQQRMNSEVITPLSSIHLDMLCHPQSLFAPPDRMMNKASNLTAFSLVESLSWHFTHSESIDPLHLCHTVPII